MALTSTLQFQNYVLVNGNRNGPYNETLTGAFLPQDNFTVAAGTTVSISGSAFPTAKLLGYSLYTAQSNVTVKFATTGSTVSVCLDGSGGAAVPGHSAHGSNPIPTDCTGISVANATGTASERFLEHPF